MATLLLAAALLGALVAATYGQPAGPGMELPLLGGVNATNALQGRSHVCPETIWNGKTGKCNAAAFEACARKLVKAYADTFTLLADSDPNEDYTLTIARSLAHVSAFSLTTGTSRFVPVITFPNAMLPTYLSLNNYAGGAAGSSNTALSYTIRRFLARCPIIVFTMDVLTVNPFFSAYATATDEVWIRLDKATHRIAAVDMEHVRYQEYLTANGAPAVIKMFPKTTLELFQGAICGIHKQYCTGPLQQYSSDAECRSFLAAIPLIDFSTTASNDVNCRWFHTTFVATDPSHHCPHLGKNSEPCRNVTYESYWKDSPFDAATFTMGGKF